MVRHVAIEPKPTKPAIGQIEVNLIAQPPLGTDAEAITYDQHSDHQFGINRGPANGAVKRSQLPPQFAKLHEPVDRAQQMIRRNVPFERELIEQRSLFDLPMPHHDPALSQRLNQRSSPRATEDFFNGIGQKQTSRLNRRSPELWRREAAENEFRSSPAAFQSSGFYAKARRYWASLLTRRRQRMLVGERLAEGVRLGSKSLCAPGKPADGSR